MCGYTAVRKDERTCLSLLTYNSTLHTLPLCATKFTTDINIDIDDDEQVKITASCRKRT